MTTKFSLKKLETSICSRLWFDVLNSLGINRECDRRTDGRTDGQNDL